MAPKMNQVLWRQSLEIHSQAARIHEDAAERFRRLGNFASATRAAEFAAAERRAHTEAPSRGGPTLPSSLEARRGRLVLDAEADVSPERAIRGVSARKNL